MVKKAPVVKKPEAAVAQPEEECVFQQAEKKPYEDPTSEDWWVEQRRVGVNWHSERYTIALSYKDDCGKQKTTYFNPKKFRAATNAEQVKLAFAAANAEAQKMGKLKAVDKDKPVVARIFSFGKLFKFKI